MLPRKPVVFRREPRTKRASRTHTLAKTGILWFCWTVRVPAPPREYNGWLGDLAESCNDVAGCSKSSQTDRNPQISSCLTEPIWLAPRRCTYGRG